MAFRAPAFECGGGGAVADDYQGVELCISARSSSDSTTWTSLPPTRSWREEMMGAGSMTMTVTRQRDLTEGTTTNQTGTSVPSV